MKEKFILPISSNTKLEGTFKLPHTQFNPVNLYTHLSKCSVTCAAVLSSVIPLYNAANKNNLIILRVHCCFESLGPLARHLLVQYAHVEGRRRSTESPVFGASKSRV